MESEKHIGSMFIVAIQAWLIDLRYSKQTDSSVYLEYFLEIINCYFNFNLIVQLIKK